MTEAKVSQQVVRTVDVGGANGPQRIVYAESGHGEDTVFLFHGVTANHRVWAPIQAELSRRFRVIAVDQRGHGRSDKPAAGYGAADYSDDVRGLVAQLGGPGRNVLVGHSLGSRNSIVTAARYPEIIDGIVAIDFNPFIETEVFDTLAARVGGGDQRFATTAEVETYLQQRYKKMPKDAVERRAEYGYEERDGVLVPLADPEAMRQTVEGLREDLTETYKRIAVPAVVIRGAESVLVTEQAFERSREVRPDLTYEVVEHADHYVPEEQPEAVARIVSDFIDRLEPRKEKE
ncbi:alpha/beta fold hydrolase [Leucobacter denitrificans]|uniref:Alpha/beta hydrolase n=1 Tax=Leucobacter denitrificans TaxID=683042 RepID=A0A7G9S387_9MICO|nr:alpha/beta hydrolase [Leucobacter denitrificans]QNN62312.1 alpha/beta hydrolase [Leucobacter denitrificans]